MRETTNFVLMSANVPSRTSIIAIKIINPLNTIKGIGKDCLKMLV